MSQRMITIQQGRSTWQGPEDAVPARLRAVPNPMTSFEDTTHAYECGYRDGQKAAQLAKPQSGNR